MAGCSGGNEALVGAWWEGPYVSAAFRRDSVCAVHETVRSDLTPNCSEAGADALSCQGQSHDEAPWCRGHTCTSPWLGDPPFSDGLSCALGTFFSILQFPQEQSPQHLRDQRGYKLQHRTGGDGKQHELQTLTLSISYRTQVHSTYVNKLESQIFPAVWCVMKQR